MIIEIPTHGHFKEVINDDADFNSFLNGLKGGKV